MYIVFVTFREGKDTAWLIVEAIILFMSLVANICLNLSIWYQERSETERLVSHVLEDLASMYCKALQYPCCSMNKFLCPPKIYCSVP